MNGNVPTTQDLLKFSNLQMAAEAFLTHSVTKRPLEDDALIAALKRGNDHSSRFTDAGAKSFNEHLPSRGLIALMAFASLLIARGSWILWID